MPPAVNTATPPAPAVSAARFKTGDHVLVAARDQSAADIKSGLYYPHYAGLRGSVLKLYGEEASVLVDRATLPVAVRERHENNENAMRQRWMDGLSEEVRGRMGAREKEFTLSYAVLVSLKDLSPDAGGSDAPAGEDAPRLSSGDLDAAEAAHLAQAQKKRGNGNGRQA